MGRLILLLVAFSCYAASLSAQGSTLGHIVRGLLTSRLVGGGYRDTLAWQASDSATLTTLQGSGLMRNESLRPPPPLDIQCPDGTDRSGKRLPQPVGYTVKAAVQADSLGRSVLFVRVSCTFTYQGSPSAFVEYGKWLVSRREGVWILGPELEHGIT